MAGTMRMMPGKARACPSGVGFSQLSWAYMFPRLGRDDEGADHQQQPDGGPTTPQAIANVASLLLRLERERAVDAKVTMYMRIPNPMPRGQQAAERELQMSLSCG
jgi:hypothetical protein